MLFLINTGVSLCTFMAVERISIRQPLILICMGSCGAKTDRCIWLKVEKNFHTLHSILPMFRLTKRMKGNIEQKKSRISVFVLLALIQLLNHAGGDG